MVGLERTVVPLIGSQEFRIASTTIVVSFIVSFGVVKAFANLISGHLADLYGRKHLLVAGWLFGLPVPFMIGWGPTWGWVVAANALLGINQGLAWSMTVIMKVDLVGPKSRGLAVGLNEFAGYLSVGLTAFLTGYIAARYGLRPQPFYLGIGYAAVGLVLATLLVRDTRHHVRLEASRHAAASMDTLGFWQIFRRTSFGDRNLFAASQAGLVNNLNDGMSWGIFPLFFASFGLGIERIGTLKAVYPVVWGVLQTVTGPLSDRWGRKGLIAAGMWVQAVALCLTAATHSYRWWLVASVLLGVGTAMVYPTLIASVSDASHPIWRITDLVGAAYAIATIGALTFASGTIVAFVMDRPRQNPSS
ncbi:MAG: MFS transporter [Acidobacteria bacterium]|nr:MAG: MFS transporter [Acidobacteriota bacterium]